MTTQSSNSNNTKVKIKIISKKEIINNARMVHNLIREIMVVVSEQN